MQMERAGTEWSSGEGGGEEEGGMGRGGRVAAAGAADAKGEIRVRRPFPRDPQLWQSPAAIDRHRLLEASLFSFVMP